MAIEFDCPNCRSRIRTPDDSAGKKALCPSCQQVVAIPGGAAPDAGIGSTPFSSPLSPPHPSPLSSPQSGSAAAPFGSRDSSYNPFREASAGPAAGASADSPFGTSRSSDAAQINPYAAAPSIATETYGAYVAPFDRDKYLKTLRIPAIFILIVAILSLGYWVVVGVASMVDFNARIQGAGNNAEVVGTLVGMAIIYVPILLVHVLSIYGSISMMRGSSYVWSWIGVIASALPCSPCCVVGLGFSIWAIVMLCQPNARSAFA